MLIAVAGCTRSVDGVASRAAGSVTSDGVDLELLSTGNYPTAPLRPYGLADTDQDGRYLEGARLAANTVVPSDVDPTLVDVGLLSAGTVVDADRLELFVGEELGETAESHGFELAFASRRSAQADDGSVGPLHLTNVVLVFADDGAARAAAADLAAAHTRQLQPDSPTTPRVLPGRPQTAAFSYDTFDGVAMAAYTPHERYVLYQWAEAPTVERAAQLVSDTLAQQEPLIDEFVPTDPADYADLPIDPSGLLARTIPVPAAARELNDNFVYSPAGAMHFQADPNRSRELFDEFGVLRMASGKTVVYETSSEDGGERMLAALSEGPSETVASAGIIGMPNVECSRLDFPIGDDGEVGSQYYCSGSAGRYLFSAKGPQEQDVHQQMAAQYLMLTAP